MRHRRPGFHPGYNVSSMANDVIYAALSSMAAQDMYGDKRHLCEKNVIYAGVVIYASRLDHLGIGVVIKPDNIRGAALADAAAVERAFVGDFAGVERGRFFQHQGARDRP